MNNSYDDMPNGYLETIHRGMAAVRGFDLRSSRGKGSQTEQIERQAICIDADVKRILALLC